MRRRDARVRHDADARSFRARSVLRACCLAMAGFCATFVVEGLLRGFGVPHAWMIFAIGSLAAAGLAPRAPWVGVGVVVLLTGAQVVSFLAAPSVSAQRMVEAALSRELGWDMTMPYTRWVTLMPRAGIVALGLVALGFVVVARRDLAAASWRELVAGHPTRRRTYLLLVGAGMVIGTASPLSAWAGYRIERREEKAAARKREDLLAALRSAFVDAWNTADVQGIAACYPEDERISRGLG